MGRRQDLEVRVLEIVDRVLRKETLEDGEVEIKAKFEAGRPIARDIAGHANAARGEEILWLFGLHEKSGSFFPFTLDYAQWHDSIGSEFCDGMPDILDSFEVRHQAGTVRVVVFGTDRAPYVVRAERLSDESVGMTREVPWKEGTKTRSATREDLLRLLVPRARVPRLQLLAASVRITPDSGRGGATASVVLACYVYPVGPEKLVIPFHESVITVRGARLGEHPLLYLSIAPPTHTLTDARGSNRRVSSVPTIELSRTEVVIHGPGMVLIEGRATCNWQDAQDEEGIEVSAALAVIGGQKHAALHCALPVATQKGDIACIWSVGDPLYLHRGF